MGLFENFVSNAKQAANAVGKKTGELADTSKLKLQAVDINTDIKKSYEALGKAFYQSKKQGADNAAEMDELVAFISQKYDELDTVNEQLAKLSSKTFCTRCGEPNPKAAGFCSKCGEKLAHEASECCACGCNATGEATKETTNE